MPAAQRHQEARSTTIDRQNAPPTTATCLVGASPAAVANLMATRSHAETLTLATCGRVNAMPKLHTRRNSTACLQTHTTASHQYILAAVYDSDTSPCLSLELSGTKVALA
jgi:hypothetical protein